MSNEQDILVAICKAANPEITSSSLEEFEDDHGPSELAFTCEVLRVLGLAGQTDRWAPTPQLYELLVERILEQGDNSPTECSSTVDNSCLVELIFIAAGWKDYGSLDGDFEFGCNVLAALGLVTRSSSGPSWNPTPRLKNMLMKRAVQSLAESSAKPIKLSKVSDRNIVTIERLGSR